MLDALTMFERFLAARSARRRALRDLVERWRRRIPSTVHPTSAISPINGRKWPYCKFRRGHAYAPGSAAASEPTGLLG